MYECPVSVFYEIDPVWSTWLDVSRKTYSGKFIDLVGVHLRDKDLFLVILTEADLRKK